MTELLKDPNLLTHNWEVGSWVLTKPKPCQDEDALLGWVPSMNALVNMVGQIIRVKKRGSAGEAVWFIVQFPGYANPHLWTWTNDWVLPTEINTDEAAAQHNLAGMDTMHWGCPKCGEAEDLSDCGQVFSSTIGHFTDLGQWEDTGDSDTDWSSYDSSYYFCNSCNNEFNEPIQYGVPNNHD